MRSEAASGEAGRWDGVAALSLCAGVYVAWAFARVFDGGTVVDRDLILIAAALSLVAWFVRDSRWFVSVQCSIPLLIGCAVMIGDPRLRAIAYGVVAACVFCGALLAASRTSFYRTGAFVVAGVALLRWVGREKVEIGREGLIVIGCVLLAVAARRERWGVAFALAAALVTPAIPSRTVAIPFLAALTVWLIALVLRAWEEEGREWVLLDAAALLAISAMLLVFPWSGVAARALPYLWRAAPSGQRLPLNYALVPGQSIEIDLPEGAQSLVVSAANALTMKPGTVVGRIDPNRVIRIGEIADWGYARRDQFWKSKNVLPPDPAGAVHGYGYDAWIDGAGRIALPPRPRRIRVTAERALPPEARLQIEYIEWGRPQ